MKYELRVSVKCKSVCPNGIKVGDMATLGGMPDKTFSDLNEAYKKAEEYNNYPSANGCTCQCEVVEVEE